jgi:DNA-binding transcriptional LysR family regulator
MLPADHALAGAKSVPAERLLGAVVAIPARSSAPEVFRALSAHAASQGVPMPRVIEVEDVSLMMTLVAAGLAISHLPEGEARIGYRGVVAIPVEPAYTTTLFGVQRKDPRSPLAEALLAEMRGP